MDLFRCRPEYVRTLIDRAEGGVRAPLTRLYWSKMTEDDVAMVDAVEALFSELVLVGGMG